MTDDDAAFRPLMSKVYPSIEVPYQLQYITHQVPTQTTSVGSPWLSALRR